MAVVALRILIVDDDKHTRRIIETYITHDQVLAAKGLEIVVAQDGKEGLAALEKGNFDLIVSDLLMPRMDGFQFCREVRSRPATKTVPIVVTSAVFKDQSTLAKLAELSVEFVGKPFSGQELLAVIRKLLKSNTPAPMTSSIEFPAPTAVLPAANAEPTSSSGSLAERSPSRVLLDLWEAQLSGILLLQRGQVKKEIALVDGRPVNVESNLRTETLSQFLIARGIIDDKKNQVALQRAQETRARYGRVLVELGYLTERDLLFHLAAQMRMKIANTLRWQDGTWTFANADAPTDRMQFPIDAPRLVFAGLKKSAKVDKIAESYGKGSWRVILTPRAQRHREAFTRVFGPDGFVQFESSPAISDLKARADFNDLLVQIDVLLTCGLMDIEAVEQATENYIDLDPTALTQLSISETKAETAAPLYDELFGQPTATAIPRNAPTRVSGVIPELLKAANRNEDSGLLLIPGVEGDAPESPPMSRVESHKEGRRLEALEALRRDIINAYLEIHTKDYFQVLKVPTDAKIEDIAAAYGDLGARFSLAQFSADELGSDYYERLLELHEVFRQAYETLSSSEKRLRYRQTLHVKELTTLAPSAIDSELLVQEASELLAAGDARLARQKLEEVVTSVSDQADYHALLGWAVFLDEGGQSTDAAEVRAAACIAWLNLEQAFAIDADNLTAHESAGRIFAVTGENERAVTHLEATLAQDPSRQEAFSALVTLLERNDDYPRLEQLYRRTIHALGSDINPDRAFDLWVRLWELYRDHLHDEKSAQLAFTVASRLRPDDARLILTLPPKAPPPAPVPESRPTPPQPKAPPAKDEDALGARRTTRVQLPVTDEEINLSDADAAFATDSNWLSNSEAVLAKWKGALAEPAPGREYFDLMIAADRWDAAYITGAVLSSHGDTTSEAVAYFQRYRPRFLVRAQARFGLELVERIRHSDDNPALSELFRIVFSAYSPTFSLTSLGVTPHDRVALDAVSEPFDNVTRYLAHELAVDMPYIYRREDIGANVQIGATWPPILLAGNEALDLTNRTELAFHIARALSYLLPGRAMTAALRSEQLKQFLMAAMSLVRPSLPVDDKTGEIASLRERFLDNMPDFILQVSPLVERVLRSSQGKLNLSKYVRGMARTADRIGLTLCNDLPVAHRVVEQSGVQGASQDLFEFALSAEFQALRKELGLSVSV